MKELIRKLRIFNRLNILESGCHGLGTNQKNLIHLVEGLERKLAELEGQEIEPQLLTDEELWQIEQDEQKKEKGVGGSYELDDMFKR